MEQQSLATFYNFSKEDFNADHKVLVKKQQPRNLNSDFFTILLIVYHMVQWIKVTRTYGQSQQQDEDY